MREEGVCVSSEHYEIFRSVLNKEDLKLEEGSPMWLLWQQQIKQTSTNPKAMRWHPLIIRWRLSIFHVSPAAYRQIASKRNKFLALPHINTLKNTKSHINYTTSKSGFNPDVIKKIVIDSNLYKLEPFQKNVSLCFDEMKFQQGLVCKRSSGKLVAFCEMGDINQEIESFQARCVAKENSILTTSKALAKYVNVICECLHGSWNLYKFRKYNWLSCFLWFYRWSVIPVGLGSYAYSWSSRI